MGLFSKKPPCPICGGKISWLLPSKIEDQCICDTCYNKIDMDRYKVNNLTMQEFKEYLAFYDENQLLKNQFIISERIDFGIWDTKIIFDYQNKLFCMNKNLNKTVFQGRHLRFFTIKEDNVLLFEGSALGICRHVSIVPEQVMAMAPQISQFMMNRQMSHTFDKLEEGKENRLAPVQYFDVQEPFHSFNVELHLEHPYWKVIKCDMDGPRFNNDHPDINDYLHAYQNSIEEIEKLVDALKIVSFPDAPEQSVGFGWAVNKTKGTSKFSESVGEEIYTSVE